MSGAQKLVTDHVLAYRECARTVWNGYFRHLPDGWHEFINVDHELFVGLVLVQAFGGHPVGSPTRDLIQVSPRFGPKGIEVLWAKEIQGHSWEWKHRQIQDPSLELSFVEFFDWRAEGIRDFEYLRARVQSCPEAPSLEGADVLIPGLAADCYVLVDELPT